MSTKIKEILMGVAVVLCVAYMFVGIVDYFFQSDKVVQQKYVNHEFVELEAWDAKDLTGLSYDSVTKIIYIFTTVRGVRIYEPYYVMNGDNEPVIGVYDGSEQME